MSDKPKKRLNSIQNLLNHNPSVILYGVGIYDFEKYKSKTSSLSIDDYILEPNIYFKNTFEDLIQNNLNEQFPLSPKDRILTFLKYVRSLTESASTPLDKYFLKQCQLIPQLVQNRCILCLMILKCAKI